MVVSFVGFVGAWTKGTLGPDALALAGIAGALVATFFTFLPSFMFILAGAPFVESTRDELRFTAPLAGISAAVVGVIVNLAAVFGVHVFQRDGGVDAAAIVVAAAAAVALFRYNAGIIRVIAAGALAGLAIAAVRGSL
jgi:chromate transporter